MRNTKAAKYGEVFIYIIRKVRGRLQNQTSAVEIARNSNKERGLSFGVVIAHTSDLEKLLLGPLYEKQ